MFKNKNRKKTILCSDWSIHIEIIVRQYSERFVCFFLLGSMEIYKSLSLDRNVVNKGGFICWVTLLYLLFLLLYLVPKRSKMFKSVYFNVLNWLEGSKRCFIVYTTMSGKLMKRKMYLLCRGHLITYRMEYWIQLELVVCLLVCLMLLSIPLYSSCVQMKRQNLSDFILVNVNFWQFPVVAEVSMRRCPGPTLLTSILNIKCK